jgi:hypothetical protein
MSFSDYSELSYINDSPKFQALAKPLQKRKGNASLDLSSSPKPALQPSPAKLRPKKLPARVQQSSKAKLAAKPKGRASSSHTKLASSPAPQDTEDLLLMLPRRHPKAKHKRKQAEVFEGASLLRFLLKGELSERQQRSLTARTHPL